MSQKPPNSLPPKHHTHPEVFIIESLTTDDERAKRFEGQQIADILRLGNKSPKYYYFQEKEELPHLVNLFRLSQYRYLHFSCHGSQSELLLTLGKLSFADFAQVFEGHLVLRRLFISACKVGNAGLTQALYRTNKGLQSIVAPVVDIQFDHAALIWASLYVSLLDKEHGAMKHGDIEKHLRLLLKLFPFADMQNKTPSEFYFAGYDPRNDKWVEKHLRGS